jgi:hypothetical protein
VYINRENAVFKSTDAGSSWSEVGRGQIPHSITSFCVSRSSKLTARTDGGIYVSNDWGITWTASYRGLRDDYVFCVISDRNGVLYAGAAGNVYRSNDDGSTWEDISTGLDAWEVLTIGLSNDGFVYAGTYNYGLFRTIDRLAKFSPPTAYYFSQNYPNPFNSKTAFDFDLPQSSDVQIVVYNALGQRVTALGSGPLASGHHTVIWEASSFPSGVYFCRIESNSFKETRKAVLVR